MTPAPTATPEQSVDVGQRPGRAFRVLAIDPGPVESAYVLYDPSDEYRFNVLGAGKVGNEEMLELCVHADADADVLIVEQVAAMGMAVGAEVFETVFWSGRFVQATNLDWHRIKRHEVKTHLCHSMRATDSNIRQALIDQWGGKAKAIGKKKQQGPLYFVKGDAWQALAVAVTWYDQNLASARCQSGAEAGE